LYVLWQKAKIRRPQTLCQERFNATRRFLSLVVGEFVTAGLPLRVPQSVEKVSKLHGFSL
jgi:hypothetical protein